MKSIFLALIVILFVSCEDLDVKPYGEVTPIIYYADEVSLNRGLAGIYGSLHQATWSTDILSGYTGSDDLTPRIGSSKWVLREGDLFYRSGTNSWLYTIWIRYYRTINVCNSYIEYAKPKNVDKDIVNDARANAYFIRGLLYFRLTTIYGDIPMPLSAHPELKIGKTEKRKVIEQCIKDFKQADSLAFNIGDKYSGYKNGFVTKSAAKAFLAKTYMQLTGWPYYEEDKWIDVKEVSKSIIDSELHSLMDDYISNFQSDTQKNKEIIFAHVCSKEDWPVSTHSRYYGYRWGNWGDLLIEHKFYNNFPKGYRKKICTVSEQDTAIYNDEVTLHFKRFINIFNHPMVSKFSFATIEGLPEFEHRWQTSNDLPVMRYAEVLLMYAEACANTGELDNALDALNLVKRRAYAKGSIFQHEVAALGSNFWKNSDEEIDYTLTELPTSTEIIDAIVLERAYEFLGEPGGNRWLDLVRLEKVGEVNAHRIPGNPGYIKDLEMPIYGDPYNKDLWWFSIPASEIALNPNLAE